MNLSNYTFRQSFVPDMMNGKFGDVIFLASLAGMGKVTFANNLIFNLLNTEQLPVLVFSFERPSSDWKYQLLTYISKANLPNKFDRQLFLSNTWDNIKAHPNPLPNKQLYIDDITSKNVQQLKERCGQISKFYDHKLGLIVIDYFELIEQNQTITTGTILTTLKDLAKQMQCPILVLSTLPSQYSKQKYTRPTIPNIPSWYEIEQQADSILFLYYPDYYFDPFYNEDNIPSTYKDGIQQTELIIEKQPNQVPRTINLSFDVIRGTYL